MSGAPTARVVSVLACLWAFAQPIGAGTGANGTEGQLRLGERHLEFAGANGHTFVDTNYGSREVGFPTSFSIWGYWFDDGTERVKIWGWYDDFSGPNRGELEIWGEDIWLKWYAGGASARMVQANRPRGNEWVHYGVVMTEAEARLYVNGNQVGSTASQSIGTNANLWLGARPDPDMHEDSFSGWLRDWIVFEGDIGDEGMRRIAAGEGLPGASVLQHLPLNEGQGDIVFDRSEHGVDGRIEGARWSADLPRIAGVGQPVPIDLHVTDARGNPLPGGTYHDLITVSSGSLSPAPVSVDDGQSTTTFKWSHDKPGTYSIAANHPALADDRFEIRVGVLDSLRDDRAAVREDAFHAIYRMGADALLDKLTPGDLKAMLATLFVITVDGDERLRNRARNATVDIIAALEHRADEVAAGPLRMALARGQDTTIRARAARAMRSLHDAESAEALFAAMEEGNPGLRIAAASALKRRGKPVKLVFSSPYEGVAWETVGHYDANLHTHTNLSDGRFDPHAVIDRYHGMGYRILALTDHDHMHVDVRPNALYPWTDLNMIYHKIKSEESVRFNRTYGELADEEWQGRDPKDLGMVSIEGSEISRTHHIASLFNDYAGGTADEETALQEIGARDGLAVFLHPGRYTFTADWYVDFYRRHPHLVGMEVYNQADRYPGDRRMWDSVLYHLMPDRPVWGFANDDTHRDVHFGWNRNVFVLSKLSKEHVFKAMEYGHFYFFVPFEQGTPPTVKLAGAVVGDGTVRLTLVGDYNRVEWITYNPDTGANHAVGHGLEVSLDDIYPPTSFVRAVIIGDEGRTYTQPFGLTATVERQTE